MVDSRQWQPDRTDARPVTVARCGDSVLVEIHHAAALLTVAQVEALHTDLERASSAVVAERRERGR